jgi:molecular chaperone DnaK
MRQRIDYGIDLGTTNSAIARMDGGDAAIVKSDDTQMDTTPSCVAFRKNKSIAVGLTAKSQSENDALSSLKHLSHGKSNSYSEFKRTMGTDHKYPSSFMQREFSSEELSAEVLKKLRGFVRDEAVESVVITVPAMFRQNQLDATQRAAELAGFKYCELLQEPIAASIAYGIRAGSIDGRWLVFDFGGGTFDAALMHVEQGIMKVVDTEGDNHLGGKDIDSAVVDKILIESLKKSHDLSGMLDAPLGRKLLQDALTPVAEKVKISLSSRKMAEEFIDDLGPDDIYADFRVTLGEYEEVCEPIFQKAIDITQALLARNGLSCSDLTSVILVGGPTFSQTLRRMLKEQVTERVDTSIDPMTAVAKGAALFASTRSIPTNLQTRDETKAQLTLKYPETTVELTENLGIRIDRLRSSNSLPKALFVEVIRADKGWSTGRVELEGDAEVLEVSLNEGRANQFEIKLSGGDGSLIPCEPSAVTIIQGLKIANATLPRTIGMDSYNVTEGKVGVWKIKGLEKNTTLPASGTETYTTQKDIRPGNKTDRLVLAFYEFDHGSDGSRAVYNEPMGSFFLTGEDLPAMLPAGSEVQVTVSFDASRRPSYSVYIPALDETIERKGERDIQQTETADDLRRSIDEALELAAVLEETIDDPILEAGRLELEELTELVEGRSDDVQTKLQARERLRKTFIALDRLEQSAQWPKVAEELTEAMEALSLNGERYGNEKAQELIAQYQKRCNHVIADKDVKVAQALTKELGMASFALIQQDIGLWMSILKDYDRDFESTEWTDKREARRLLADAKSMLATNPSKNKVETAVRALWNLLPPGKEPAADQRVSKELLRR